MTEAAIASVTVVDAISLVFLARHMRRYQVVGKHWISDNPHRWRRGRDSSCFRRFTAGIGDRR